MFAVLEFLDSDGEPSNEISIVPLGWICKNDKKCYWPISTAAGVSFKEFVKQHYPYKNSWPRYKIGKFFYKSETYEAAEAKLDELLNSVSEEAEETNASVKTFTQKHVLIEYDISSSDDDENWVEKSGPTLLNKTPSKISEQLKNNKPSTSQSPQTKTSCTVCFHRNSCAVCAGMHTSLNCIFNGN